MGRPWARLVQNYINHPKFLALTSNAICLWHEGKNYADMHQTDGLIPREALKTFRWTGRKTIGLLLASCGQKPDQTAYAPLWEELAGFGFKMHDYLEHNDCREEVLDRMEKADEARLKDKQRKVEARAAKKAKADDAVAARIEAQLSASRPLVVHDLSARTNDGTNLGPSEDRPTNVLLYTETETETETSVPTGQTEERTSVVSGNLNRDPFTDPAITMRAGNFIRRYRALYVLHRYGARYAGNETRDYDAAVRLCEIWDDERLDKLAVCFLTTDHKFATEGSRTIPQFKALASWLDGELSKWEHDQQVRV